MSKVKSENFMVERDTKKGRLERQPSSVPFIVQYESRNNQVHFFWVQRYVIILKLPNFFGTFL